MCGLCRCPKWSIIDSQTVLDCLFSGMTFHVLNVFRWFTSNRCGQLTLLDSTVLWCVRSIGSGGANSWGRALSGMLRCSSRIDDQSGWPDEENPILSPRLPSGIVCSRFRSRSVFNLETGCDWSSWIAGSYVTSSPSTSLLIAERTGRSWIGCDWRNPLLVPSLLLQQQQQLGSLWAHLSVLSQWKQ